MASTGPATSATATPTSLAPKSCSGYAPQVTFEDGMGALVEWLQSQRAVDRVDDATNELAARGLTR